MAEPPERRLPRFPSESSDPGGEAALPPVLDGAVVESRAMADGRTITYYRWPEPSAYVSTAKDRDEGV